MASYVVGCLALLSFGVVGSVAAQRAPRTGLVAVSLPTQTSAPARAATASVAAPVAPADAPAAPALFRADSIFINPQVLPQFTGGEAALRAYFTKNLRYPPEALRQHVSGKVMVNFVLGATGLVTYATVVRGPNKLLNEEALRLVWHMPTWQPARQHGQPVRVSCTIPVIFAE